MDVNQRLYMYVVKCNLTHLEETSQQGICEKLTLKSRLCKKKEKKIKQHEEKIGVIASVITNRRKKTKILTKGYFLERP